METNELLNTRDGMVWAKEFVKIYNSDPNLSITVDWMHTWFANAIETGFNLGFQSSAKEQEKYQNDLKAIDTHGRQPEDYYNKSWIKGYLQGCKEAEEKHRMIVTGHNISSVLNTSSNVLPGLISEMMECKFSPCDAFKEACQTSSSYIPQDYNI